MEVTEAVVQTCSVKKGVLRNFAKFTEQHLCLRPAILFKKRLWHRCFPVNFAKFFIEHLFYRTPPVAASEVSIETICRKSVDNEIGSLFDNKKSAFYFLLYRTILIKEVFFQVKAITFFCKMCL